MCAKADASEIASKACVAGVPKTRGFRVLGWRFARSCSQEARAIVFARRTEPCDLGHTSADSRASRIRAVAHCRKYWEIAERNSAIFIEMQALRGAAAGSNVDDALRPLKERYHAVLGEIDQHTSDCPVCNGFEVE